MRKILFVLVSFCLISINIYAQETSDPKGGEKLETNTTNSNTESPQNNSVEGTGNASLAKTQSTLSTSSTTSDGSTEVPGKAFEPKTFAQNPDLLGIISNSVNLYTGGVALPLNLISIPGRNGLNANVAINYSSDIHHLIKTWNQDAPTGILGLGWSMDYPKIIVDNKGTGTRDDDVFYLVEGGSSIELICIAKNQTDNTYTYSSKTYANWKITYYETSEYWVIEKENGMKYYYGNSSDSKQYIVKWGNWIGNSAQPTGQSQQVSIWNLSSIENYWKDNIRYEYDDTLGTVGTGNKLYTVASYLKRIYADGGQVIEFQYANKNNNEYQDPHTEQLTEPDAYQERLETRYLNSILVKSKNNNTLFNVNFAYQPYTYNGIVKRQLISITQSNFEGETLPPLSFQYNSFEPNTGALSTVTLPEGGMVTYSYASEQISKSVRDLTISSPGEDWSEPRVWIAKDYVVVTWRQWTNYDGNKNAQNVKVYVYEWNGKWTGGYVTTLSGIVLDGKHQSFDISLQEKFFTVLSYPDKDIQDSHRSFYNVYIVSKDEKKSGNWNVFTDQLGSGYYNGTIGGGDNFATIGIQTNPSPTGNQSLVVTYTKNASGSWTISHGTPLLDSYSPSMSGCAKNNYILSHVSNANSSTSDLINLYHLDRLGHWNYNSFATSYKAGSAVKWYGGNSIAFALPYGCWNYAVRWDDDYTYHEIGVGNVIGQNLQLESPVFVLGNSMGVIAAPIYTQVLRFDGLNWYGIGSGIINYYNTCLQVLDDCIILRRDNTNLDRYDFDPNKLSWYASPHLLDHF
ncbi:MAG: hypothetical protein Q8940_18700 [Bacteroidota bacterium]|nr:hypothetical protein [Bacteroidota bacterium]